MSIICMKDKRKVDAYSEIKTKGKDYLLRLCAKNVICIQTEEHRKTIFGGGTQIILSPVSSQTHHRNH